MIDEQHGSRGIEMHEAHFPGRAPVEAYGNGGFRFAEMSHQGSILCLPEGIFAWHVEQASELTPDHFERCLLYTSPSPRDRTRSRMPSSA